MGSIASVRAYANNEVAYVAWDVDGKIPGCLGFEVVRVYVDQHGQTLNRDDGTPDRVNCATWVAFKGQKNPNWIPQNTSVWPVQKLSWRDLTLRKRRNGAKRRPDDVYAKYEVRPVGDLRPGLEPVPIATKGTVRIIKRDEQGKPVKEASGEWARVDVAPYEGKVRPLAYLDSPSTSNVIHVTKKRGQFTSTFTNGILAAQWLKNVLLEDGTITPNELLKKIENPDDPHRRYLAGDVIPLIREYFDQRGEFYLGLYELEDKELEELLLQHKDRIHIILSNTGLVDAKWDARNKPARQRLIDAGVDIQHRMFNNSTHIGHNKFVVHFSESQEPVSVLTGSTNWTSTGLAGQTNNALIIENAEIAKAYLDYWQRMFDDKLKLPRPLSKGMGANQQSLEFRRSNWSFVQSPRTGNAAIRLWFSPNMDQRKKPTSKSKKAPTPPDLQDVYRLMRQAKEAIVFLAFYPGQRGNDCIIGEAIDIGLKDDNLIVAGAVSSAQAMPNYEPKQKDEDGDTAEEGESPTTFNTKNVSIVRASRIDDSRIMGDFGAEQLRAKGAVGAIIHDKIAVIDPMSSNCHVILGSHNLGFKASYSNDENMVIVSGDRALAQAYCVHVLDVIDHYRFRAIETELRKKKKKGWSGFLETDDGWLDPYVKHQKGALSRYLANGDV